MPQLRHLAIAAEDPTRLASFYHEVFGLKTVQDSASTIVLSDGTFSLALFARGPHHAPGLYRLGFQGPGIETVRERLMGSGLADRPSPGPGTGPFEQRQVSDPDGNLLAVYEKEFDVSPEEGLVRIRHTALYTPDPQRLADFYCGVFGMQEVARSDRSSIFVSDGYFNLALLFQRAEEKLGLHHFGFHVTDNEEIQRRVTGAGLLAGTRRPDRIPYAEYRVQDPEGNGFDISEKGWQV